jgi:hypothetical protein
MPGSLPLCVVTEVALAGRVGLGDAGRLARALWRRGRRGGPARYAVDCAAVTGFSESALVALGVLGEELRARGSALVLANGPWRRPRRGPGRRPLASAPPCDRSHELPAGAAADGPHGHTATRRVSPPSRPQEQAFPFTLPINDNE